MSKTKKSNVVTVNLPKEKNYDDVKLLPSQIHDAFKILNAAVENPESRKDLINKTDNTPDDKVISSKLTDKNPFAKAWEFLSNGGKIEDYSKSMAEYIVKPILEMLNISVNMIDEIINRYEYTGVQISRYWSMLVFSKKDADMFNQLTEDIIKEIESFKKDGFDNLTDVEKVGRIFGIYVENAA